MARLPCDRRLHRVIDHADGIIEKRFGAGSWDTNKQESKWEGKKKMR
jgi:hypothetical protein